MLTDGIDQEIPGIQVGGYIEKRGIDLFQLAKEKGLEGIIAKRKGSTYQPGRRSPDWLKIKARPQQEFVVCGFTEGKGSRKHFGALLLGAYRNGRLRYLSLRYRVYRKGIEGSNRSTEAVFYEPT
jgi:bifunctional non-homologous end joining protein LigD